MNYLANQTNDNKKQKSTLSNNHQGAGSEYHKEHAGNVEGYGEPHPITNDVSNTTKDNGQ